MMQILIYLLQSNAPERTEITNCYSPQSTFQLNRNLRQFEIILVPNLKQECEILPKGVQINLTLADPNIPIITISIDNFNYLETTQIIFEIPAMVTDVMIDGYTTEHYGIIQIYSYSHIILVELLIFDEVKSQLRSCFDLIDVHIQKLQVQLSAKPTKYCQQQFVDKITNVKSYIDKIQLQLNEYFFDVDAALFMSDYQNNLQIDQSLNDINSQIQLLNLEQFIKGTLHIYTIQGQNEVTLQYEVQQVELESVSNLFEYSQILLQNKMFQIRFDLNVLSMNNLVSLITYDQQHYRLSVKFQNEVLVFQKTYQSFDPSLRFIEFSCEMASDNDKCEQYYDICIKNENQCQFEFDIMFFSGKTLTMTQRIALQYQWSCWERIVLQQRKDQICIDSETRKQDVQCTKLLNSQDSIPCEVKLIVLQQNLKNDNNQLFLSVQPSFGKQEHELCFACKQDDIRCSDTIKYFLKQKQQDDQYFYLAMTPNGQVQNYSTITNKIIKQNYLNVTIIIVALGCVIVSVNFILTIIQTVKTSKKIKLMKKQQRSKQTRNTYQQGPQKFSPMEMNLSEK